MPLADISGLARLADETLAALRARFAAAGWDEDFLGAAEDVAPQMLDRLRIPLVRAWLDGRPGPAADCATMFCYRGAVPRARAAAALGEALLGPLRDAGLLVANAAGDVSSPFLLLPFGGQWFLSDYLDGGGDVVMGPGMTTVLLHRIAPELHAERVLDLGCGAGSLGLDAARRGARVVLADLSERALAIARFNARLNAVPAECVAGDVTEPVRDERFDLVLAQPPYVPAVGDGGTTYLHGGRYGDELAMRFVAGAARVLAPGGVALLHFDSLVRPREPLGDRLRAAVGDAPVDTLALVAPGARPDVHAVLYSGMEHPDLGEDFAAAARAQRAHFAALGVSETSRVLVALHRPRHGEAAGGRYRIVRPAPPFAGLRPGAVREALAALDLASGDEAGLRASRLSPPADAEFRGAWRSPADESPARLEIAFGAGSLAQGRELGERGWLLFGLFDGRRTFDEAAAAYADELGLAPPEATRDVLGFARDALARGLLRIAPEA